MGMKQVLLESEYPGEQWSYFEIMIAEILKKMLKNEILSKLK